MSIATKSFNIAINTLKALGAEFVIVDKDGNTHSHGNLQVAVKPKRTRKFSYGTYAKRVRELGIASMQVGDVMTFDPEELDVESLRTSVISYANQHWKANSVTTSVSNGKIEALRIL